MFDKYKYMPCQCFCHSKYDDVSLYYQCKCKCNTANKEANEKPAIECLQEEHQFQLKVRDVQIEVLKSHVKLGTQTIRESHTLIKAYETELAQKEQENQHLKAQLQSLCPSLNTIAEKLKQSKSQYKKSELIIEIESRIDAFIEFLKLQND